MAKILIVEDYLDLQDFFKFLLKLNNFDVKSVGNGAELNALLDSFVPDLILMDVMLGGEDGREICRQIKQKHKEIAVILISANHKFLLNYEEYGADDIIEKPFNIEDVLSKVNKLLPKKDN